MIRDNNASGLIPLSINRIIQIGFKEEKTDLIYRDDYAIYCIEWDVGSQGYKVGLWNGGNPIFFCFDLKFVHELERLIVALTGKVR